MRSKEAIRRTKGTDSKSLVITVDANDHQQMIALFLAAKAWGLKQFSLAQQRMTFAEARSRLIAGRQATANRYV